MPLVSLSSLPDSARVWVFAADRPLDERASERLLNLVDDYLERWQAHGEPLRSARDWREGRFLAVGVDPTSANASGCSVDGLFRAMRGLGSEIGAQIVGGGRVFFRDAGGQVQMADRASVGELARSGAITGDSPVFDTTITALADWRERFERPARESWVASLLEA